MTRPDVIIDTPIEMEHESYCKKVVKKHDDLAHQPT
jgi:hypothetical protein